MTLDDKKLPTALIVIGMAGSGKTTFMQRLNAHLHTNSSQHYTINLDPAVSSIPFGANIDIRDTIDYKQVMSTYNLGPNGAILTSLNLFTTKFNQVLNLIVKKQNLDYILIDTPGQIEIFTWSASGQIITESLALSYPTVVVYVIDTPRSTSPATFMSNMLYACSILYKTKLPFILVFNKIDVVDHAFAIEWMTDFDAFQNALENDTSYMGTLVNSMCLVLEEFYNCLKVVGVSALTGDGMDDFFNSVKLGRKEYYQEYKVEMDALIKEREEKARLVQRENLEKLAADLKI